MVHEIPWWMKIFFIFQGGYFFVTALWPFLHLESFLWVTGPKTDIWLVKMVSLFIFSTAGLILWSVWTPVYLSSAIASAVVFNCFSLAAVDFYYVLHDIISDIYLVDAILEIIFISVWLYLLVSQSTSHRRPAE